MSVSLLPRVAWQRRRCVQLACWALSLAVGCTDSSKTQAGADQVADIGPSSAEVAPAVAEEDRGFDSGPELDSAPQAEVTQPPDTAPELDSAPEAEVTQLPDSGPELDSAPEAEVTQLPDSGPKRDSAPEAEVTQLPDTGPELDSAPKAEVPQPPDTGAELDSTPQAEVTQLPDSGPELDSTPQAEVTQLPDSGPELDSAPKAEVTQPPDSGPELDSAPEAEVGQIADTAKDLAGETAQDSLADLPAADTATAKTCTPTAPPTELCDGVDNDCDGTTDDVTCDDGNACTTESCNAASGCVFVGNQVGCSDGNACTTEDKCKAGTCVAGAALVCDDNDPCTTDSCNAVKGCVAVPYTGTNSCSCSGQPGQVCSNDKGVWTQLVASGLPKARVRAIAVNSNGHLFATLYGFGVYRSTDGGATFAKLGVPNTVNDPVHLTVLTMGLNHLGEPVVGVIPPGSGQSSIAVVRFSSATNSWVTAKLSQQLNLGGYFAIGFHLDPDGHLLSSWPFRNDIQRSIDGGSTWDSSYPIPNASHKPPNGPSALVKAVYGTNVDPVSGEIFCGTEGDQWWHSTDNGATWSMIDEGGTSPIATEPGQNGFLVAFNKDHEVLIGTMGKPNGHFLQRWTADGAMVDSNKGFGPWAMVGTATMGTVLREVILTSEGYSFLAMPINNGAGGSLPCDLYGSSDGADWSKMSAPFVPELNAISAYGDSVLVGGSQLSPGAIWKFTPKSESLLPKVSTGVAPGKALSCPASGLTLYGSASDPEGKPITYTWKARGPGKVTFGSPSAATTSASFGTGGDYVLTLLASDGARSAGAPVIVHVNAP